MCSVVTGATLRPPISLLSHSSSPSHRHATPSLGLRAPFQGSPACVPALPSTSCNRLKDFKFYVKNFSQSIKWNFNQL